MKPDIPIGPWPLGMDTVSASTRLSPKALRDAWNVDIDRSGGVTRRNALTSALAIPGAHSFTSTSQGALFVAAAVLYSFDGVNATAIATLNSDDPCRCTELDQDVVVSNRTTLLRLRDLVASPLGLPIPSAPSALASDAGGLAAGQYGIAVAFLRGDEEGPLSALAIVNVLDGGGITLSEMPVDANATALRVYRTECNSEVLYQCADLPLNLFSWSLGIGALGKSPPFQYTEPMRPGEYVTTWRGRLLTACGRNIYLSKPLAYGVMSSRFGFIRAPHRIVMLHGMRGGVYVGTAKGDSKHVWFLQGTSPKNVEWQSVSAPPPINGCYAAANGSSLDPKLEMDGAELLIWLSRDGFVVARDDGQTLSPQAARINGVVGDTGRMVLDSRRVTAVVS